MAENPTERSGPLSHDLMRARLIPLMTKYGEGG